MCTNARYNNIAIGRVSQITRLFRCILNCICFKLRFILTIMDKESGISVRELISISKKEKEKKKSAGGE